MSAIEKKYRMKLSKLMCVNTFAFLLYELPNINSMKGEDITNSDM